MELDELVAIGDHMCAELNHAQAMNLIDKESGTLNLKVKRSERKAHDVISDHVTFTNCFTFTQLACTFVSRTSSGFHTSCSDQSLLQSSVRVLSPPVALLNSSSFLPAELPRGVTSPPDSEAYYGETDSDADTHLHTHQRRQRRTSPHARPPARTDNQEEETSEMSG